MVQRLLVLLFLVLAAPALAKQSYAPLVKKAAPAVVNIYTKRTVHASASPFLADPFFNRFFGDMLPPGMTEDRVQRSLGSGVLVTGDGTVITNHHVIKGAEEVTVVLSDRREFEARVLGSDERTDLAVLKVEAPQGEILPTLPLGDSDSLEVGDIVIAIGNPFGVGQTVTSGIVSALARTNIGGSDYRSFIQTDAAINPGNSGGALIDLDGQLVGVNSAIYSQSGGSVGIGFAIPSALVKTVLAGITQSGKVVHPWLGVSVQPITAELAHALELPRPAGVLINGLVADGPAAMAGVRSGDILLALNGREVADPESLRFRLATLVPGDKVALTLRRNQEEKILSAQVMAPPEKPARDTSTLSGSHPLAGATVANLNPALAEEIGAGSEASGVVILSIQRGSTAHRLRWRVGDILLRINDRPVARVSELKELLEAAPRRWWVTFRRGGEVLDLQVGR